MREVRAGDISAILDKASAAGKSRKTLTHIRAAANIVFDALWREEAIADNPVARVRVPRKALDKRERAVLTDHEIAVYLTWEHPVERHRLGVLERQVMGIIEPDTRTAFVFTNNARDCLLMYFADESGDQTLVKKLEKGAFLLPAPDREGAEFVTMKPKMLSRLFR